MKRMTFLAAFQLMLLPAIAQTPVWLDPKAEGGKSEQ